MQELTVNYWAILVCGIASMIIGSLWYGPLFGKTWQTMVGWDKVDPAERERRMKGVWKSYVLAFIGALIMAFVLHHSIIFAQTFSNLPDSSAAWQGALWNWLGFIAPVTLGAVLWENKSWKFWILTSAYYLVQLLVFAYILVYWR